MFRASHTLSLKDTDLLVKSYPTFPIGTRFTKLSAWLGPFGLAVFLLFYTAAYLAVPLVETDPTQPDSHLQTRGAFAVSIVLFPEQVSMAWTAGGTMPSEVLDRLPHLALAIGWLTLSWFIGGGWLRRLGVASQVSLSERMGLAMASGMGAQSLVVFLVAVVGLADRRWPLVVALMILLATGAVGWLHSKAPCATRRERGVSNARERRWIFFLAFGCLAMTALYMLGAVLPPIEFDVREYHLQIPKEIAQTGRLGFFAHNIYGNMPLGAEMHSLASMILWGGSDGWFQGALVGKLITASYATIAAAILGGMVSRFAGAVSGWSTAALWLSIPGIAEVSKLGLIEPALACYLGAAFSLLTIFPKQDALSLGRTRNWALLFGWMIGCAAACKYTALPWIVVPAMAMLVFILAKQTMLRRTKWSIVGWAIVAALVGGGGWYAKNWILASNPVYPLASQVFGGRTLNEQKANQWRKAHRVPTTVIANSNHADWPDYRWSTIVNELFDYGLASRYQSLTLLPCAFVGFLLAPRQIRIWAGLWWLWYWATWFLVTHRLERFWLPSLPLLAIFGGMGAGFLLRWNRGWVGGTFLGFGLIIHFAFVAVWPFSDNRYFVRLTALREDQFTRANEPDAPPEMLREQGVPMRVPAHQYWLNTNLQDSDRILMVGDAQVFDVRVPVSYSTCFDRSLIEDVAEQNGPKEALEVLIDNNITYIAVHWAEIARYRSPGNYGFAESVQPELFDRLVEASVIVPVPWNVPNSFVQLYRVNSDRDE